jgi:hypothetical protein
MTKNVASGGMRIGTACGVAALTAMLALTAAPAQSPEDASTRRAMASNGVVVPMPKIAGLDCEGMAEALRRIDLSNYRGAEPVPKGHRDRPIFDYEDRLARAYYTQCTLHEQALHDPGPAFSFGFKAQ